MKKVIKCSYGPAGFEYDTNESDVARMKRLADNATWLTQADGLRMYFDGEDEDTCLYDSVKIFNFLSMCEELFSELSECNYSDAEYLIDHINSYL